jgi:hypothetical protein
MTKFDLWCNRVALTYPRWFALVACFIMGGLLYAALPHEYAWKCTLFAVPPTWLILVWVLTVPGNRTMNEDLLNQTHPTAPDMPEDVRLDNLFSRLFNYKFSSACRYLKGDERYADLVWPLNGQCLRDALYHYAVTYDKKCPEYIRKNPAAHFTTS